MEPEQESCLMDGGSFGLDYNTLLKALDGYPNKILEYPDCYRNVKRKSFLNHRTKIGCGNMRPEVKLYN